MKFRSILACFSTLMVLACSEDSANAPAVEATGPGGTSTEPGVSPASSTESGTSSPSSTESGTSSQSSTAPSAEVGTNAKSDQGPSVDPGTVQNTDPNTNVSLATLNQTRDRIGDGQLGQAGSTSSGGKLAGAGGSASLAVPTLAPSASSADDSSAASAGTTLDSPPGGTSDPPPGMTADPPAGEVSDSGAASGAVSAGAAAPTTTVPTVTPSIETPKPTPATTTKAGTLTAGAWDDNLNFDWYKSFVQNFTNQQPAGLPPFTAQQRDDAYARAMQKPLPRMVLDVALVIDTTGSMSDELSYLQTEFTWISAKIGERYPNADQRWSLLLYRDTGDEYVLRYFDFRTGLTDYQSNLMAQRASGGGDMPEAVDQALDFAGKFAWRTSPLAARLLFWVADAPHHEEKAMAFADAVTKLANLDVHVYPVASSGINDLSEFSMRSAAQLTLGRYLFLTNDSGVGNSHAVPKTPCYYVTKLNEAVVRMVDLEMTGAHQLPDPANVIRSVGSPNEQGVCTLDGYPLSYAL